MILAAMYFDTKRELNTRVSYIVNDFARFSFLSKLIPIPMSPGNTTDVSQQRLTFAKRMQQLKWNSNSICYIVAKHSKSVL